MKPLNFFEYWNQFTKNYHIPALKIFFWPIVFTSFLGTPTLAVLAYITLITMQAHLFFKFFITIFFIILLCINAYLGYRLCIKDYVLYKRTFKS